ncbi:MAG: acetylornithine transaminase [Propionibacteriaceae bacterium]|jgi:acetylornithine aminotransferase|nr:acetylornithine transaminase [Propionibacteriaceae bacterium]
MATDAKAIEDASLTGGTAGLMERYGDTMMHTFNPQRVFVRGAGSQLWDADAKQYTDFLCGLAVNVLGHCHPAVQAAVAAQLGTLDHISNIFASPTQVALAERLVRIVRGVDVAGESDTAIPVEVRVFFTNSGAEANEAAFKLTRLTGRTKVVAMEGSFHGRTMGAVAITSTEKYRKPFEPLPGEVVFVPYGDVAALEREVDADCAAVVLEPVQGENGVIPAPDGYLAAARELTDQVGALLWVDEVQTGLGRCGEWLVSIADGVLPDIITVAKGLGNGFPVGACLAIGETANAFTPGAHGTTFGGNPVAAAAGLAVLDVLECEGLVAKANTLGAYLVSALMATNNPHIVAVRGRGLLRGIVLDQPIAAKLQLALLDAGWVVNAPRETVIRVAPPLITTTAELDAFVAVFTTVLDRVVLE